MSVHVLLPGEGEMGRRSAKRSDYQLEGLAAGEWTPRMGLRSSEWAPRRRTDGPRSIFLKGGGPQSRAAGIGRVMVGP